MYKSSILDFLWANELLLWGCRSIKVEYEIDQDPSLNRIQQRCLLSRSSETQRSHPDSSTETPNHTVSNPETQKDNAQSQLKLITKQSENIRKSSESLQVTWKNARKQLFEIINYLRNSSDLGWSSKSPSQSPQEIYLHEIIEIAKNFFFQIIKIWILKSSIFNNK